MNCDIADRVFSAMQRYCGLEETSRFDFVEAYACRAQPPLSWSSVGKNGLMVHFLQTPVDKIYVTVEGDKHTSAFVHAISQCNLQISKLLTRK